MAAVLVTGSGAVAGGDGVESLFKPAFVIEVLEELVAAVEEFARCLVGGAGDVGCGQVVLGALDGGAGALVGGVGGAEVVGPGQQVVEGGRQGVRRCALIGVVISRSLVLVAAALSASHCRWLAARWSASSTMNNPPIGRRSP